MKQVIQNFKSGELLVDDVPAPSLSPGFVLVQNHFSLISAGTERSTVSTGQASLLGKARQRPDLVKQVLATYRKEGFFETLKRVRTKLETLKELGYSSAGKVLMSMDTNGSFLPGERVACGGGGYASHAGIIAVPQNLIVKVPKSVGLDHAAFTTLGAIAMQGVRQANPKLGEYVCVIGLGLLGQITAQILRANGCHVFGIDTSLEMVALAKKLKCREALTRQDPGLSSALDAFTAGRGFDSVIITAASQSADPIELSTSILRSKGVIVVVGAVPMNVPREPHFYRKELELKISCSYGPGRYDHTYEEQGHDYPYGYVRWTENRNMDAFIKLLENESIDLKPLITHVFAIDDATEAYDIITGKKKERAIGILLKYPEIADSSRIKLNGSAPGAAKSLGIGFIGAGSFAQKFLIPNCKQSGELIAVVTSRGVTAKSVGEKFLFARFGTDPKEVLADPAINTIFIATRHNTHANFAISALQADKNVFVEKPLALTEGDLSAIGRIASERKNCRLMVGFNRRFAPLALEAKRIFSAFHEPLVINYRVNAGFIPKNHWVQTAEGGGRILGEVCHFVDFIQFVTGALPERVFAECISSSNENTTNRDNVAITLRLSDGSIGQIVYVANGSALLNKERIEISGGGSTFVIDDFKVGELFSDGNFKKIQKPGKGHHEEVEVFLKSIREGSPSPISLESLLATTAATFEILNSLQTGLPGDVPNALAISDKPLNGTQAA